MCSICIFWVFIKITIVIKVKEAKNLRSRVNNRNWREERERGKVM